MSELVLQQRIPVTAEHVEVEVIDDEVVLYHPQKTAAVYLNSTAAMVWGLCDGIRTVAEIVNLLAASYSEDQPIIADGVAVAIEGLQKDGMIAFR